jgi:hypothetical protein
VNGAIAERVAERVVDEPVLLHEAEAGEAGGGDVDLKVIACPRAIAD